MRALEYNEEAVRSILRSRISQRGITSRSSTNLHLFVAFRERNWERVIIDELRNFARVTHFDWADHGFDEDSVDWLDNGRALMNACLIQSLNEAHAKQPINLFIGYLSNRTVSPQIIDYISKSGIVTVNLSLDDLHAFWGARVRDIWSGNAPLIRAFDLNWTSTLCTCKWYLAEGGLPLFMPEAANPAVHRPYEITRDIEVSFVGQRYSHRPLLIEKLRKNGIAVRTFGPGWESGPLSIEEMVKLYSQSVITLGFGGVNYSRNIVCLKGRDFEVPMSGGLYLTQYNPELELCYELGSEILCYESDQDLISKIRAGLADRNRLEQIRTAGRARALRDHTWNRRVRKLLSVLGFGA